MSQFISLQKAVDMTGLYRGEKQNILKTTYQGQNILPLSEAFDRDVFDSVLAQRGCAGLRIYLGMKEDLNICAIIVGTDEDGNDMLPAELNTEDSIIENGNRCPDICPDPSPLNS
jgi:hypothetical protein